MAAGSTVTAVMKKHVPTVRKSYDSYHEKLSQLSGKAVTAIMKKLSQLSGKSCLLWAEVNEVRWVLSDCWEGHFNIYFMDVAENGKISLKGILLFLV